MRIGIDLGGTKIEAVALDDAGTTLARRRGDTPQGSYEQTLETIKDLVDRLECDVGARGSVGVGTPGALSVHTGLMKNANSTALIGHALDKDLACVLEREVRIANDANCFALSEATDGAAAGAPVVFGVIVGTGTGAGVVVDGNVLAGANAIAGEWGHNAMPWPRAGEWPGPPCYCHRSGCIETFLSGPGFARDYREVAGTECAPADIVALASKGDAHARACLARYEERMARALAHVINILDPDVIVLGGGMSNIECLYANVPRLWGRHVFSDRVSTRLARPTHGAASGVRGAAWLWPRQ